MSFHKVVGLSPIIPVVVIENIDDALPLAKAIYEGGISTIEVTLRTSAGLKAIELISKNIPEMYVCAGTVCNKNDFINAKKAGAQCIFSPGISNELIEASIEHNIPLIPGVATASEVMLAQNNDIFLCKLFPATIVGGLDILKAFSGPFPKMKFCPTGGVNLENMNDFLDLENVICIGGSWIVSSKLIKEKDFEKIKYLCNEALNNIKL